MARAKRLRLLVVVLAALGWVLPTAWPGRGVPVRMIGSPPREGYDQQWYQVEVYLVECGFFSRGGEVYHNQEGGWGFTGSRAWLPGYLLPLLFVGSVIALVKRPTLNRFLTWAWVFMRVCAVCLSIWGASTFYLADQIPWSSLVLVPGYLAFWILLRRLSARGAPSDSAARYARLAALQPLFYPVWIACLMAVHRVPPFVGLLLYLAAAILLAHRGWAAEPPRSTDAATEQADVMMDREVRESVSNGRSQPRR